MTPGDWITAVVAIVAVVVAAISAYFAFVQARSAKASATSSEQQAFAAREGVTAAREQVAAAHRQAELQEQMWRDQAQPYVVADVRPDPTHAQFLQVVVENRGSTIARNVQVRFDPPVMSVRNGDEHPFTALDNGVSYLPPGRQVAWSLGVARQHYTNNKPVPDRAVTVTCDGPLGPVEPLHYTLDLEVLRYTSAVGPGSLTKVEGAIKNIVTELQKRRP